MYSYNKKGTDANARLFIAYLSTAMASKWRMEAVQQRTSLMVHISHNWEPNVHSLLIWKIKKEKNMSLTSVLKKAAACVAF